MYLADNDQSVVALVFKGLFIVVQHLAILIRSDSIQTLLVVLVSSNCALVSNVLERAIESCLRSNKEHEILYSAERA